MVLLLSFFAVLLGGPLLSAAEGVEEETDIFLLLYKSPSELTKAEKTLIKNYFSEKERLEIEDEQFGTPLCIAAQKGHGEIVDFLIKVGADINKRCFGGNTPSHYAALNGNESVVQLLIEKGADLTIQNDDQKFIPRQLWEARSGDFDQKFGKLIEEMKTKKARSLSSALKAIAH